jgi:hypothetical protein
MSNQQLHQKAQSAGQGGQLLDVLKARFVNNPRRHSGIEWDKVQANIQQQAVKLWSLNEMETTGGEPDVISVDQQTGEYVFCDCAAESPKGRRSLCYDRQAHYERKEFKPEDTAIDRAAAMGIAFLNEEQYRWLQTLGEFDTKTSSWLTTPASIRKLDGAIIGDRRYNTVFTYHNGAGSYYAARGFRGILRV